MKDEIILDDMTTTDDEYTAIIANQDKIIGELQIQNKFMGGLFFGMILIISFFLVYHFGRWISSLIRL